MGVVTAAAFWPQNLALTAGLGPVLACLEEAGGPMWTGGGLKLRLGHLLAANSEAIDQDLSLKRDPMWPSAASLVLTLF